MPYHRSGGVTYGGLGRECPLKEAEPPDEADDMKRLREVAENCGVRVWIGDSRALRSCRSWREEIWSGKGERV